MNQGLIIAIAMSAVVGIALIRAAKVSGLFTGVNGQPRSSGGHGEATQMLSETVEYRTSLSPALALETVEAKLAAEPTRGGAPRDVRLTEKTQTSLRFAVTNRMTAFLEAVVAAAPWGSGSKTTLDVVRWLDNDSAHTAPENLRSMREDIEAALRSADPDLVILVRAND